jgi:hypothetical protein
MTSIHIFQTVTNTQQDVPIDDYIAWAMQDGWGAPLHGVENPFFVTSESIALLEEKIPSVKDFRVKMSHLRLWHSGGKKHITVRAIYQHMIDNRFEQKIIGGNVCTNNTILMLEHWECETTKGYSDIVSDFMPQFRDQHMTKPVR